MANNLSGKSNRDREINRDSPRMICRPARKGLDFDELSSGLTSMSSLRA